MVCVSYLLPCISNLLLPCLKLYNLLNKSGKRGIRCRPSGFKQSGLGREFSLEGMLDSFTQRKSVTVNLAV